MIVPHYNLPNGDFLGLEMRLAYIVLRGDVEEVFLSCSFNIEKSKVLFCSAKDRIPNAFTSTAFKKHYYMIIDGRHTKQKSDLFYNFSSTTNRKRSINQYMENVNLNPIDCLYQNFKKYSSNQNEVYPHHFLHIKMLMKQAIQI